MKRLVLACLLLLFPTLATSTTFYAAVSSSNTSNCTQAQTRSTPIRSIAAAAACMSGGDALVILAGTYDEVLGDIFPSGTAGTPTMVRAEVRGSVVIQPTQQSQLYRGTGVVTVCGRSYITFDGLIVDGSNLINPYLFSGWGVPSGCAANQFITITNNELRNTLSANDATNTNGLTIDHMDHGWIVRGNYIHDIGTNDQAGQAFYSYCIYAAGKNMTIDDNELARCSGHGIHMFNAQPTGNGTDNSVVKNNVIHHNGSRGILLCAGGFNCQAYNNLLYNNGTLDQDGRMGIQVGGYGRFSSGSIVANNTVYATTGECIAIGGPIISNGNTVQNNICYLNTSGDTVTVRSGTGNNLANNLLGTNPQFQ